MRIDNADLLEMHDAMSIAVEALTHSKPARYEEAEKRHADAINALRDAMAIIRPYRP